MKRMITSLLTVAALIAVVLLASGARRHLTLLSVVHAQNGCSNTTLLGNYGLTFSGFQLESGKSVPFYGAGLATSDGAGNFAAAFAASENSSLPGNKYVASTDEQYIATYTVNSNCTGLLTAIPGSGGDNFAFVIVNGGAEILATDISAPDTLNLDLKKQ
jgi:hypothetical protein